MAPNTVEVQLKGPNWLFGQRKPAETFPTTKITPALETSYFRKEDCLKINCTMGVVVSTIDYSIPHSIQGERFHAHKLVLPARSSIFRSIFFYDESDGEKNEVDESDDLKEIIIDDMVPKVLKLMELCQAKEVGNFKEKLAIENFYIITEIIGHSMGAGIAAILTYMLRENKKLPSSYCLAFGPAACMTWDLAEFGKDFVTTVVNRNDLVPSFGIVSADSLRTEVMASSWAPDLREQIQQTRILGFVNRSVSFMRSHIPFISNPRSKVADVNMLLSRTPEVETKLSADARAAVKKHSALSCWSFVAANRQTLESVLNPTQSIAALMSTYVGIEKDTDKPTAGELASCSPKEIDKEKELDEEHMEQLVDLRSSSSASQEPCQLYPPGRIMHMVVLPAPEERNTREQGSQDEVVAIYETPRSMYSKIRLARSMIRDHYMPRYIETMEMLIGKLAEDEDSDTDDWLD